MASQGKRVGTRKVLAVFANPKDTDSLRVGEEQRVIQQCIEQCAPNGRLRVDVRTAATVDDLSRALLSERYLIVHLSGHGTEHGFYLEDEHGNFFVPPPAALAKLLGDYSPPIECVVLNSCYSLRCGMLAAFNVPYTIASEGPLSDRSAIEFSRGFYDAIARNWKVVDAYHEGVRRCLLKGCKPHDVPTLLERNDILRRPRNQLPIPLDDGSVVLPQEVVAEGQCRCERNACVGFDRKVYCYFKSGLSKWVIVKNLYWRCYDEIIRCPRCRRQHKRGHVGRPRICRVPYRHPVLQRD
ncbi:CHAT domain-containing protein [Sorangium sp. So ce367]|uniref:CHAT domain-containing protein n=1 Tax=Sorangium sp. So ce367 TaxID=3133305 RepID=UPI003F5EB226